MKQMTPNTVYTLSTRRPLTREEYRRRFRFGISIICAVITLIIGIIIGYLYWHPGTAPASKPQQVTGKLETPVIARVALLAPIENAPNEQVNTEANQLTWDTPLTDTELDALLEACEDGDIPVEIALGLIQAESSFNPDAVNPRSGSYGYCQLNPRYFPTGLSPVDNIRIGIAYLAEQLERYDGDLEAALTAYNAGHDTGDRTYADNVLEAAATFREGR